MEIDMCLFFFKVSVTSLLLTEHIYTEQGEEAP